MSVQEVRAGLGEENASTIVGDMLEGVMVQGSGERGGGDDVGEETDGPAGVAGVRDLRGQRELPQQPHALGR